MNALSRRTLLLGLIALLFLSGFGWLIATQGPLAPARVTVTKVKETTLNRSLFGIGTVEARCSYAIGPTASGRVARVLADQGDRVAAGQVLAEMDPVDMDARLAASAASAARATQLVAAAQAALAEASSRAHQAQNSSERFATLRQKNFISEEALEAKRHEAAAANAAQEAALASLAAAKNEVKRARADYSGAIQSRAHLRLISPVNGVVSARLAEAGTTVAAGQSVIQVIDPATLWLRVRIDQGRSGGLALGLPADIALRSKPGQMLKGRVDRVDLVGDAVTEERIANVGFDDLPGQIAIGDLAEVSLYLPPIANVLAVPAAAIKRTGQTEGVWRLIEARATFAAVATGAVSSDGYVQLTSGLALDDEVIVHSTKALVADQRVKVVDALTKAAP